MISREDIAIVRWFERTYVRPHRWTMLGATVLLFVSNAAISGQIMLIRPALDQGLLGQDAFLVWAIPLAVMVMAAINGLASFIQGIWTERVNQRIITVLQRQILDHYLHADTATINETHSGDVMAVALQHTQLAVGSIAGIGISLMRDAGLCVCMVAIMVWHDWQLSIVAMAVTPLAAAGMRRIGQGIKRSTRAMMEIGQQFNRMMTEVFSSIRLVKLQGTERAEIARFEAASQERRRLAMRLARIGAAGTPVNEVVGGAAIAGVLLYALVRAESGGASLGTFGTFLAALLMAHQPLKRLARTVTMLNAGVVAARAIKTVLDGRPAIVDAPGAHPLVVSAGRIRFENVSFAYRPDVPALRDVSFEVGPGQVLALVGPSGGGKSTIISLLPRLYDVGAGRITIDGVDIRDVTLASLRAAIGVVSQDNYIFDNTIRANLTYARIEANDAELDAATRIAGLYDYIHGLPDGYDSMVGEAGLRLSGGQRQRLAIARAVLKDAPILVLDEATSALDYETERAVKAALKQVMAGRTTIVVAHRLATIVDADLICVVADGRIVESGTHAGLMAQNGLYARLVALQDDAAEAAAEIPALAGP